MNELLNGVDPDLIFIIGLVLGVLSIPSMLSAYSEGRSPRGAAIVILIAGGLITLGISQKPGGYSVNDVPDVFASVVSRYILN